MAGELTLLQLNALIDAGIKINGNKEITPPIHNNIEKKLAVSSLNKKDGGDMEALIRYVSEFVMTDRKHIPFVGYVDDLGMAVLQDAKDYTDQEIGLIPAPDLTALWNLDGNTFDARKKLGSASGDFGFDFIKNNTVHGGLSDTAKWYWGTNAAFTDTDHSFRGSGNTSASFNEVRQNSDATVLGWTRNDGVNYARDLLVGNTSGHVPGSRVTLYGATSNADEFVVRLRDSSFNNICLMRNDGLNAYKYQLVNPNNLTSGWDSSTAAYFYADSTNDAGKFAARFRKADFNTIMDLRSDGNIGIGGGSYGSGVGVMFMANAGTNPSSAPTGGNLLWAQGGGLYSRGTANTSAANIVEFQNSDNSQRAWLRGDGLFSASNGYAQGSNVIAQEVSSRVKLGSITDNKGIDFVTGGFTVMSADYADFLTFNGVSGTIFRRNSVEAMRITTDGTNPVIVMSSRFYNNGDSNPTADLFQRKLFRNNGDEALNYSDMQKHNVSPTSPNRTVQVVVNGETIYLHGKTTND